jgi:putative membrane protein
MKKAIIILSTAIIVMACNNESNDSVDKADSANKKNIDSPSTNSQTVMTDEESSSFLVKAADGSMMEVQLGQMARERGIDLKLKSFAAMMVHDHSAASDEVKAMAANRNVVLPPSVSDDGKKIIDDLTSKTSKAFDRAYADAVIKKHQSDIDMFEKAGDKVNDSEIKIFINNTIPKLKNHVDSLKEIRKWLR